MKNMQVIRTQFSPYHKGDFAKLEMVALEKLPGITYRSLKEFTDEESILITNTHTKLSDLPKELLKTTKLIIHPNSGYDHFSADYELWKNIPVVVGHTIRAQAVAEYTLSAVFQGLAELPQHTQWDTKRRWDRKLIKGQKIWVFGYGHIGKIVADSLHALGAKITVVDPYIHSCPYPHLTEWADGEVKEAKAVLVCCGLNSTSKEMFNKSFFQAVNKSLVFINGARGKIVNEEALRSYILSHPEAQAFLDVFEKEPFGLEWRGFPQAWKTSHIAGVFEGLDEVMIQFEATVLEKFLKLNQKDFLETYKKELLQNKWIQGELM